MTKRSLLVCLWTLTSGPTAHAEDRKASAYPTTAPAAQYRMASVKDELVLARSAAPPEFWNPKLRAPNCFNPAAVRSVLPEYLARTEWVLAGTSKQQLIANSRSAFASGRFTAPEAGSFSFMLSKDGYLSDEAGGPWLPHVMLFVAHGQAEAWGAGKAGSPILGQDGSPFEPTILFIPVRTWSDGSPAPPVVPPDHKM